MLGAPNRAVRRRFDLDFRRSSIMTTGLQVTVDDLARFAKGRASKAASSTGPAPAWSWPTADRGGGRRAARLPRGRPGLGPGAKLRPMNKLYATERSASGTGLRLMGIFGLVEEKPGGRRSGGVLRMCKLSVGSCIAGGTARWRDHRHRGVGLPRGDETLPGTLSPYWSVSWPAIWCLPACVFCNASREAATTGLRIQSHPSCEAPGPGYAFQYRPFTGSELSHRS
jgi:hypothetical protein